MIFRLVPVPMLQAIIIVTISMLSSVLPKTAVAFDQSQPSAKTGCHVDSVDYKGWHAQQLSNSWVQLTLVPQNGGRLMQVVFDGHSFLFVNPKFAGKYFPPTEEKWFNYGGDKLWLLPEGNHDEQHWVGNSDLLDDGPYSFRVLTQKPNCVVELSSPANSPTGIQFIRTIALEPDSPRILFHATMKNVSGRPVEWSMQSVSQYDTAASSPSRINPNFYTFTPVNPTSSYLNQYHVRFGPAENPAASVREDGLFVVHYAHLAAELWLDSTKGWVAVADGATKYTMVERFHYEQDKPYPGRASVIFWTNGPAIRMNSEREATLGGGEEGQPPYYLEAELNSPLCRLQPGESCSMDTEWLPTRGGTDFHSVADPGIISESLRATTLDNGRIKLMGAFGVFFSGKLIAHLYSEHGSSLGTVPIGAANPAALVTLNAEINSSGNVARISLHLEDDSGLDRGSFQEVKVSPLETR